MDIRALSSDADRRLAVPILQQLWTDKSPAEIMAWTAQEAYTLIGGFVDGELIAVAGVRIDDFLHHTRHAWLYDFVVDEPSRGEGYGTALLEYVEEWASSNECDVIGLASPLAKSQEHQYYTAREYDKWGYVLEKEL
ncbi:GNAT family N-acetyltransferase [Natronolimnobius sp. AArcel1]|uniref:GNAT family N-acetyltransferase n=1 Tax=Natronolimnobius sp. AArcel1 TaxID=1679093 RepID=UPI0013EA7EF9|nr:GNAT family N-acetyltransferase [Natronolimnobius sp. AArcel1]NGM69471.1 GNAT family N-acetyltransferase [Natronolimnobius sp. AArcel1]